MREALCLLATWLKFLALLALTHPAMSRSATFDEQAMEDRGKHQGQDEDEEEACPIEEVELTVPKGDDPSLPALTFRTWTLGLWSCLVLSFLNMFFGYRSSPLNINGLVAQIVTLPIGRFMAAKLPSTVYRFPGTNYAFSLNPGPFNVKEHVLITIFGNAGAGGVYAVHIVTSLKAFYRRKITFHVGLLITLTTQILGFGFAGLFRKFLIEPASMWWPSNLVQVSLFRTLHEEEKRKKGDLSRLQFFSIALIASFAYYVLPGFLFTFLTTISWVCFVFPKSIIGQQLGSGTVGYSLGAVSLDWSTITGFFQISPLATPFFAILNMFAGFFITMYLLIPVAYWKYDMYGARKYPLLSRQLFTDAGGIYNTTRVISNEFTLDHTAYNDYGRPNIAITFVVTYGIGFATLAASITHMLLFHGKEIWRLTKGAMRETKPDIHMKLMQAYPQVPAWWFVTLLVGTLTVAVAVSEIYIRELQLKWWGVLFAAGLAFIFILPIGILTATTNQAPALNIITEYLIGYIYPGRPIANVLFKTYGTIANYQTISLLSDFKIGHYMKIPPKDMFLAQVIGTVVAAVTYVATAWWLLESVPNICNQELVNNPWSCPGDTIFYDASVLWGLIGPQRVFGSLGKYKMLNWCFLFGALAPVPVWLLGKAFPKVSWLRSVIVPVLISGAGYMPYAYTSSYWAWFVIGFIFNYLVFKYNKKWWQKHNYVLSAALDAGLAFMAVLLYFTLQMQDKAISWSDRLDNQCPLATCPTYPGMHSRPECKVFTE